MVAYDRLIEAPGVFYITFDNVEVGRMQARAIFEAQPKGNYVMIKGSPTDPNADFLRGDQQEIIDAAVKKGDIKIVGEEYTEGWKPAADPFMTAILLLADAPGGGTSYTAIARHRSPDSRQAHEQMGFFDGWGTVATQLEAYARGLSR